MKIILLQLLASIIVTVAGALLTWFLVWLRAKYKEKEAVCAAIDYLAAGIADTDTRFARAWKLQNSDHKLDKNQILELEKIARDEALILSSGDCEAQNYLSNLKPPEVSALVKEIICKRFS